MLIRGRTFAPSWSLASQRMIGLFLAVLLAVLGCQPRSVEDAVGIDPSKPTEPLSAIEAVAETRRDGNGDFIEVDLRGADSVEILSQLADLPKLRSLILAGTPASDEHLESIANIATLENLDLRQCPVTDGGLAKLAGLKRLKAIKLSGKDSVTKVGDDALQSLASLPNLKVLALDYLPITDTGFAALGANKQWVELYLAGTEITDESAETLATFSELKKCRLAATDFSDSGVKQLAGLSQLVDLDLSECVGVGDASGQPLGSLAKLSKLNLWSTGMGDAGAEQLAASDSLRWLNLDNTQLTDRALPAIGKLRGLTFLHLGSTAITDDGLPALADLKQLEKLVVTRTGVTADGVQALQEQLPSTEIQLVYVPGK
ncbi:hypothetical protein FYK55_01580 [Roseiconus nitratireducens]|uniref:Internalin-A n=1 Tax=Roseiconus nitratireducens TaxID=2605748 RepID=A0A5M6DI50_9BACT|nr:hypothetical protein [Roseiconus nitratireducens]KAA5547133.1 hypothetical protein FYK55_01580 [Roseiconus nitratireducens]